MVLSLRTPPFLLLSHFLLLWSFLLLSPFLLLVPTNLPNTKGSISERCKFFEKAKYEHIN
jgi:hypothetical protein